MKKKQKEDFLDECMKTSGVSASIDQFQMAFCQRCVNTACKRSKTNDLLWMGRMERQLQALYEPEFGDLKDPQFMRLAKQEFRTLDPNPIRVSWDVPVTKKDPIVHYADPPEERLDAKKDDEGVSNLKGKTSKGDEPAKPVPPEPPPKPELDAGKENPEPPKLDPHPYNTTVPVSGIMLEGDPKLLPVRSSEDAWEIKGPSGKKQKMVVDISTGKVKK